MGGLEPPTSWLRTRHSGQLSYTLWCGRRESNPLPRRWQRRVLPIVNYYHVEEGGGIEPLPVTIPRCSRPVADHPAAPSGSRGGESPHSAALADDMAISFESVYRQNASYPDRESNPVRRLERPGF